MNLAASAPLKKRKLLMISKPDISFSAETDVPINMAELQIQNYEGLRQREDVTYDEIKTIKENTEINHLVVKPRNRWLKHFLLILLISVLSAGVASAITYLTVCAQLKQFTLDLIEKKVTDIERKYEMKDQEMEKRYNLTSSSLQKQITDSTEMVGFTAFGNVLRGNQLLFPIIKSSVGISNLSSIKNYGTFICEKKGLYLVIVTVMVCPSRRGGFCIYKNNQRYMEYYSGRSDRSNEDCKSGTGTAVIAFNVNDTFNVRIDFASRLDEQYSSFSAVKLK